MTDPQGSPAESYSVCTTNGVTTNCQPVPVASLTQCPTPPPVPWYVTSAACALWTSSTGTSTVTLSAAAPAGGTLVSLGYSLEGGGASPATGPATVLVPAGATSANFPMTVGAISGTSAVVAVTASANGTSVPSDIAVYSGNLFASVAYQIGSSIPYEDSGSVEACARSGGGVATFSASNGNARLEAVSATLSASGWGTVGLVGESVVIASDTITATYEGSTASVVVAVGELKAGGGGCKGTTCQ
jgi:hypothetical protein